MLFNSLEFVFFFVVVTVLYFTLPQKYRWFLLLAASCYFYMFFIPYYIVILFSTIIIDYFAGIQIERATGRKRKLNLIFSLIANIGILMVFKYYNFFIDNINFFNQSIFKADPLPYWSIILPVGLSFHTFQALSYSIEVYRGNHKAERHFGIYALYVMFYPQLVAGPIERPQNMLHQFYEKHHVDLIRIANGLKLMAWGLFKKVVIADRLAIVVNQVYDHPQQYEGTALIIATVFFAFQIYCDFSGYTDIALGAAEVMGFRLMKNFNAPYLAKNIADFWKRWHISLSTWFRDYLYISIGGSKVKISRWYFNLLFVFIVSGFWHGANWTFIIWGALNGIYLVAAVVKEKFFAKKKKVKESLVSEIFQIVTTFILVSFAWIFFRANSWSDAWYIVTHLTSNLFSKVIALKSYLNSGLFSGFFGIKIKNFDFTEWVLCFVLIVILFITDTIINRHGDIVSYVNKKPAAVRWILYYVIILSIIFLGKFGEAKFIYFQF